MMVKHLAGDQHTWSWYSQQLTVASRSGGLYWLHTFFFPNAHYTSISRFPAVITMLSLIGTIYIYTYIYIYVCLKYFRIAALLYSNMACCKISWLFGWGFPSQVWRHPRAVITMYPLSRIDYGIVLLLFFFFQELLSSFVIYRLLSSLVYYLAIRL